MKLNQLRDLVAIVEHGGLRAAARRLGVAQPLLTRSVRGLEKELGTPLFERQARGMVLTPLGRLFHERARGMVNELRRARDELAQAQGSGAGTVIAGLSIMPHMGLLPRALPAFRRRYPQVYLQLIEGLFPDLESQLRSGAIDFYLGAAPGTVPAGFIVERLFSNTRAVVCRKGHPLARSRSLKALAGAEWALPSTDYDNQDDLARLFQEYGLPSPRVALQARTALSMMVALANSDLLALLPVQWREFDLTRDSLQVIAVRESLPAPDIVLIRRAEMPMTPAAEHLCDLMQRNAPSLQPTRGRA
ncbi:LysR substrate-binding domain-containing protein [Pigmentiphaga sp. GD03639]|uniref:LysR substrate-binding domain-containing protein n=1 Tax=Pigmentiphaga daeguensis TaxID=414049 RepID=A0ABN1C8A0_9BURK|nr:MULTISPECIES: LysR substrate-binding domain-containing protein [unclassified Pigmentiphaga]MDH2236683.1 LysR substrate-binding domain-containing protein [Pigmentiphaga sp. GD03639]OVZ65548.1 LysR family transcriptional regulator [Pigmentiphaga sp. NML030171]